LVNFFHKGLTSQEQRVVHVENRLSSENELVGIQIGIIELVNVIRC
jgi:hypothetical protein